MSEDFKKILADGDFLPPDKGEPLYVEIYNDANADTITYGLVSGYENLKIRGHGLTQKQRSFANSATKPIFLGYNNCSCPFVSQIMAGFRVNPNTGETNILITAYNDGDDGRIIDGDGQSLGISAEFTLKNEGNLIIQNKLEGWQNIDVQVFKESYTEVDKQGNISKVVSITMVDNAADKVTDEKAKFKTSKRGSTLLLYYPLCDNNDPNNPQYEEVPQKIKVENAFRDTKWEIAENVFKTIGNRTIDLTVKVEANKDNGALEYTDYSNDMNNRKTDKDYVDSSGKTKVPYLGYHITSEMNTCPQTVTPIKFNNEPEIATLDIAGMHQNKNPKKFYSRG